MDSNQAPQIVTPAATWPTPPPPSGDGNGVFIGRFGLRAGWGIAIYILIFATLLAIVTFASLAATGKLKDAMAKQATKAKTQSSSAPAQPKPNPEIKVNDAILNEGGGFLAVAFATWILSRIERRRNGVYGIGNNRRRDFLPGAFWGIACLSALVGVLRATHVLVFDGRALTGLPIFVFGVKWLLLFLLVGFLEEYLTRGYLQYTLTRGLFGLGNLISPTNARAIAFWFAAVITSFIFGAVRLANPGETTPGIIAVFVVGMVFSYVLWHTGSLWWGIGFHMAWDWAQSFLYGVPDSGTLNVGRLFNTHPTGNPLLSGGITGPEGSV